MSLEPKPASPATSRANEAAAAALDLPDDRDWARARRGLLAAPPSPRIPADAPVWNLESYDFLDDPEPPATVHPSLWRQARLNRNAGLYEVVEGIWQVRGYDLANISFVAGETGWIVVDPLTVPETARAALELANAVLGERPVTAVIFTHPHVDHFGGVHGVLDPAVIESGSVPIIAPAGFLAAAVDENVIAGNAMARRAMYMYGSLLPIGPRGHVDAGLGKGLPFARPALVAPNTDVSETGATLTVDGVPIEFQFTVGAEAPTEIDFYFPGHRALCMAENCSGTLHNVATPRGAKVRDALGWSKYLNEAIHLYGDRSDVMFTSHHWPVWGRDDLIESMARQRDAYRFIHDETMRWAGHGYTIDEIAERVELPSALRRETSCRPYYGTVNHNCKAVYQHYLGWFDGNPAHLHRHPPAELGTRYVAALGGADAALEVARRHHDEGDDRFASELASHIVFAHPEHRAARELLADSLEQLGYRSESAPWRSFYLNGANELRNGTLRGATPPYAPDEEVIAAMTAAQVIDFLAVCVDGVWAAEHPMRAGLTIDGARLLFEVSNGTIHAHPVTHGREPLEVSCSLAAFSSWVTGRSRPDDDAASGVVAVEGDVAPLARLFDHVDRFERFFDIVAPGPDRS